MLVLPVIPFPAINPVLISIGPFAVRWYALAYIVGIIAGWFYARAIIASDKLWSGHAPFSVTDFDDFVIWITLGIILGGRIGYVLFYNLPHFAANPIEIFQLWNGGLFLGRLANFINGELWGRAADVPWAMVFPHGSAVPRHPSQLYEAALEGVVLFVVLALLVRSGALKRPGVVTGVFALGYGVARMTCELFREPDPQLGFLWGGMTMGMLLCIPLILAGIALLAVAFRREPSRPAPKPEHG